MHIRTVTLGVLLSGGVFPLAPASVFAQGSEAASTERLASEYQRLRADLDKVNAEVAALKRGERSVRNDYRLRDKMAEAEALARKLTDAEARLRVARGASPPETGVGAVEPPVATPQDGAVELEAKADLLSDQARRFQAEADALVRTAEQIRARQAMRRRASAWERDPLAGFEASKRNLAISGQGSRLGSTGESSSGAGATRGAPTTQGTGGASKSAASDSATANPPPPALIVPSGPTGASPVLTPTSSASSGSATVGVSPTAAPVPSTSHPLTAPVAGSADSVSKAAGQERPLLDPTALATIRSSLSQAGSLSNPETVEAAATALRQHAQALEEQARRLRVRAGHE